MKNTYWILTTCHNLLNENDAEKMKDGKGQGIDRLKEKVKENLSYAKFLLPDLDPDSDKHFQLTREMSSKDVICDDRSLVYDSVSVNVDVCTYVHNIVCIQCEVCWLYMLVVCKYMCVSCTCMYVCM